MQAYGRLIVLEGVDGSGTTTQARLLQASLLARGVDCVLTAEPTPGPVGKLIRAALTHSLKADDGSTPVTLDAATLALLFAADRSDHNRRLIQPALQRGAVVISDRYTLSSLIYQSLTAPSGEDWLPWLQHINRSALRPHLLIVLDIDAAAARERRLLRGGRPELFEQDGLQERLAAAYLQAERFSPEQAIEHLAGAQPSEVVAAEVGRLVDGLLAKRVAP
jgi:dTMP kinase